MNSFVTVIIALLVSIICGLLNGLIIIKLRINSFVATLATQFVFKGLVTGISEGYPYTEINEGFTFLGRNKFLGLPLLLYLAVLTLVIVGYIFRYTVIGRRILATGGNEKAASMASVNTKNMILIGNILSGLFAGIAGIYRPDLGGVYLDGEKVEFKSYRDSIAHDISMVHQEIQVISKATIAENIVLYKLQDLKKGGKVDWKRINETALKYLDMVELDVKPADIIENMTAAQKQLIQIAKALSCNTKYILLDEPTSSLTTFEVQVLFKILFRLKEQECGIIFVLHKIEEVMQICDVVSILCDGCMMGTHRIKDITRQDMIRVMIGREENVEHMGFLNMQEEVVLEAKDVGRAGVFDHMNFQLHKGEILDFYGLVGSGRTELARVLVGADQKDAGEIYVHGEKTEIHSMVDAVYKYKVGYVTETEKKKENLLS